ncbi:MAG: hypothetical protein H6584_02015 [Flavobacteriales bacterium]|nr:hypothetical protein [Flavobacteriales bacterium]
MKHFIFFIFIALVSTNLSLAQDLKTAITTKKKGGEIQFYQGDKKLNLREVKSIFESNELAYEQIKSAKSTYTWGFVLGTIGGGFIGYPLGQALSGGDPLWAMAGVGAGLIIISIPITRNYNKKAIQALETYNSGLQTTSYKNTKELKFLSNSSGVGLAYSF